MYSVDWIFIYRLMFTRLSEIFESIVEYMYSFGIFHAIANE